MAPKGNKNAIGNNGGRPTKYKPEYCQKIIDFFNIEAFIDKEIPHYGASGEIKWTDFKRMANTFPTLIKFAREINVSYYTVYNWTKEHPEFLQAYKEAKKLQEDFLIENGLNGNYNALFAKFVAVNVTSLKDEADKPVVPVNFNVDVKDFQNRTAAEIARDYNDLLKGISGSK